jgi:hypothetical protein
MSLYKLASTTPALDTGSLRLQLLEEYGEWINDWVQRGWDGYLVTVMFHNLSGSMDSQITQMHQEVTALFSKLVKRVVRKPRSPAWVPLLPKGIFVPDLPVFKRTKTPLNDVVTNNGLHMHGIILAHRWGRLTDPLDVHFSEKRRTYVAGKIRSIDVVKITERPQYTTDYAGKGLKRPCFNPDHILILPRALSELPDHSVPRKTGVRQPGITLTRVGNRE